MKKQRSCRQVLRIVHVLLFCGLAVLLAAGLVMCVRTIPPALSGALAAVGAVLLAVSLVLAIRKLCCPHCGASWMLRGRLPLSLPAYCPGCGTKL